MQKLLESANAHKFLACPFQGKLPLPADTEFVINKVRFAKQRPLLLTPLVHPPDKRPEMKIGVNKRAAYDDKAIGLSQRTVRQMPKPSPVIVAKHFPIDWRNDLPNMSPNFILAWRSDPNRLFGEYRSEVREASSHVPVYRSVKLEYTDPAYAGVRLRGRWLPPNLSSVAAKAIALPWFPATPNERRIE